MMAKRQSPTTDPAPSFPPVEEQLAIILRGVDYGDPALFEAMRDELRQRLAESRSRGRPLTAYVGIDPTATDLTLGHTVPLRKLRQLQDLGHRAIFVIGTMTAVVGDPSERSSARRRLTPEEVSSNAATYIEQAFIVLDPERTEIRRNGDWLAPLTFAEVIDLASNFTVQQFLQRDNFSRRFQNNDPIWLHEFFYALMQAYDAFHLGTDIQVGGTEQLFNLMAGRKLQEAAGQRPQIPLTLPILVGTDGHMRMSKTTGNYVGVLDKPEDQFGKTMSIPDDAMPNWLNLVTSLHPRDIDQLLADIRNGSVHPMEAKKVLAREVVTLFHGPGAAEAAEDYFARTIQHGDQPHDEELSSFELGAPLTLIDALTRTGLAPSRSEARRLLAQRSVRIDGELVTDGAMSVEPKEPQVLQVGKRRFVRLVPRDGS